LEASRSAMSQTEKKSVATFNEKMVFAKSYSPQLPRSRAGARCAGDEVVIDRPRGIACAELPFVLTRSSGEANYLAWSSTASATARRFAV
jgi:hypothetical protein